MTVFEHIKNMTVEELARYLNSEDIVLSSCSKEFCPLYDSENDGGINCVHEYTDCHKAIVKFLESEAIPKGSHASWLYTCPCNDGNFNIHLKEASKEEINRVLAFLPEKGNKTKIKVLKAELKRRDKEGNPNEMSV